MNNRFDQEATRWDQEERRVKMAAAIADAMSGALQLGPNRDLLDFGAGTGLVSLRLQPLVRKVYAFDTSAGMLQALGDKLAQNHVGNVELVQGTSGESSPKLPTVDIVVSSMALHHVRDIPAIARAFKSALRPNGQLAIADLDPEGGLFHAEHGDVMHDGFDHDRLKDIFAAAGFVDIAFREACAIEKPAADGTARQFTIFLMTARS
jgi:ubiquinone/menaquinone biosynthesis C-methylase UbiE